MAVAINFVGIEKLMTIPGIGESLAKLILAVRESHGNITPDTLIGLTRGKVSRDAMDRIDFSFNDDYGDDAQGFFDSLIETVKREPHMADQGTAQPGATCKKLSSLVAAAQAKRVQLDTPVSHQQPEATGRLATLFASAHGKRVQLDSPEPEHNKNCVKAELGSSAAAPGISGGKPLNAATSDRSPDVTSGDLEVMLAELQRLRSEMVTPGPSMHINSAESDLPPLPDAPKSQISASSLPRPVMTAGATTPSHEATFLPHDGNFARVGALPERRKLTFDDSLAAKDNNYAYEGGQPVVSGLVPGVDLKAIEKQRKHTVDIMKSLPKGLVFDGKSNWFAFKHKFELYATKLGWTSDDCFNCLCWSLTNKAADFYAILLEQKHKLNYRQLLSKLENRFGAKELPATAQGLFQQAIQAPRETLEDWADRVMSLATRAFRDLPEQYSNSQAVVRFCQGLADKEAGHHVCIREPKSIEEALNGVKWYQYVHQSMYGENRKDSQIPEYEDPVSVYNVTERPSRGVAEAASASPQSANLQDEIRSGLASYFGDLGDLKQSQRETIAVRSISDPVNKTSGSDIPKQTPIEARIDSLEASMKELIALTKARPQGPSRPQGGGFRPRERLGDDQYKQRWRNVECFECGEKGHIARDCKTKQSQNEGTKALNGKGSGGAANSRPSH